MMFLRPSRARARRLAASSAAVTFLAATLAAAAEPVKVIFDTDFETDVDDVGALAVLHALADNGEAEILCTIVVGNHSYSAAAVDVINTYYGRGDIPIGSINRSGTSSKYAQPLADNFPQDTGTVAPNAVATYREILAAQPDNSVTIMTVGYTTNIRNLLDSGPDQFSPLTGAELVAQKAAKWVNMGGNFETRTGISSTTNPNWTSDRTATVESINAWPTELVFNGREIGHSMKAGDRLDQTPADNPVRVAYELFLGSTRDHHLADLSTVLYAVRGLDHTVGGVTEKYWAQEFGQITMNPDATFTWTPGAIAPGDRTESRLIDAITNPDLGLMTPAQVQEVIEDLLIQAPRGADTTAPTAPTNAAAQASTTFAGRMHLSWDAAGETDLGSWVAGYQIYRDGELVGRSLGLSFVDYVPTTGEHEYTIAAYNASGVQGDMLQLSVTADTSAGSGSGLKGEYFNNKTLAGDPALTRTDAQVGFNWGNYSPDPAVQTEGFSARWTGQIEAAHALGTQAYTLTTVSNDGVRLWINGELIIDDWNNGADQVNTAEIEFEAGQRYDIVLEYYDNTNTASVELRWETLGLPQELVPTQRLYSVPEPASMTLLSLGVLVTLARRRARR